MSEVGDPAIKLFGRIIPLPQLQIHDLSADKECLVADTGECREMEDPSVEKSCTQDTSSELDNSRENNRQGLIHENEGEVNCDQGEDQCVDSDTKGIEKSLRKPDKVLPCPRCKSLETKFCYFNNYSVYQPRHFCKSCQRYWTAGGTIRNVPLGTRRRKNKHSSSQYHQVVGQPNAVPVTQGGTLNVVGQQHLSPCGLPASPKPVNEMKEGLSSVSDALLVESTETASNQKHQMRNSETGSAADGDGGSLSATASQHIACLTKEMKQGGLPGYDNDSSHMYTMQYCPVPQWAKTPSWGIMMFGSDSSNPNPSHVGPLPMVTVPSFCTPTFAFPFVPSLYWGYMPSWDSRKWNSQLVGSAGSLSLLSSSGNSGCSGNSSATLGKYARDANVHEDVITKQCLWVPKTLRIDDPEEAAKSSIWSTLRIKQDKNELVVRGGIFKAFRKKSDTKTQTLDADRVLQANPAALSRSQSFQETT
ncbi:hypothetical protein ACFX1R_041922 [Malus domestica]|uniref:cyclic dof factor 1-like isoform X1 n=2 Tax=Malus domestica TaxID=3750 RepID=UPI0010AB2BAF|nr:cyclic dof factor 3-like [Malus domestica]